METQFDNSGFYFQWHFSEACNLRCKHCYQNEYKPQEINISLIDSVISQMSNALIKWNINGRVSLTGGEPLLNCDILFYILEKLSCVDNINHIGILTNGTLISDDIVDELSTFKKLKEIQISLDGATSKVHDNIRGVGVFNKAIDGIKKIVDSEINSAIMFTVSQINMYDAVPAIDLAIDLGVDAITVERYTPVHGKDDPLALTPELTKIIFEKIFDKKKSIALNKNIKIRTSRPLWNLLSDSIGGVCPVGFSCLTIMHDGIVYPCRRLPITLGSIQNDGIFKIWYTSPVLWKLRNRNIIESCSSCSHIYQCSGCRAAAYFYSNNYLGKDPLCWKN